LSSSTSEQRRTSRVTTELFCGRHASAANPLVVDQDDEPVEAVAADQQAFLVAGQEPGGPVSEAAVADLRRWRSMYQRIDLEADIAVVTV
jgi:hypothetical protein